ncbi:MAG: J domain-containing protein [Halomonas subglaciescola]|nr:J domain-containing protein [Halomonas subglaciescola]
MPIARFSPFELLLLQSHSQVDTATLLLLAWVLVQRDTVSDGQRCRRLTQEAANLGHGHDLGPIMRIAARRDIQAIQLAAEVLRHSCTAEQGLAVMHKAIAVATDDGRLSLANHYILRLLADLLQIAPATLETLFQELAGAALVSPQDPSRDAYWRAHNPEHYRRQAERDAAQARAQADARQQAEHQERERARRQQQESRREQARQQREREQRRHDQQRRPQASTPPPDRTLRALAVLELSPGASRSDIRLAYRRMAQLHHPDRVFSQSEQKIALASQRFQRIKKAYDYLMRRH